jgi:hypothetical protein
MKKGDLVRYKDKIYKVYMVLGQIAWLEDESSPMDVRQVNLSEVTPV